MSFRCSHAALLLLGLIFWAAEDRTDAFTLNAGTSIPPRMTSTIQGGRIFLNGGDVVFRGLSAGGAEINLKDGAVEVGGTTICKSYMDVVTSKEPIYQKSPDGSTWYANVKVGMPMNRAEIDAFEANWPKYAEGREERIQRALKTALDPNWGASLARDKKSCALRGFFTSFLPSFRWRWW